MRTHESAGFDSSYGLRFLDVLEAVADPLEASRDIRAGQPKHTWRGQIELQSSAHVLLIENTEEG